MDDIGMFKGKYIGEMSHDELLDFARWAGKRISALEQIERETRDYRIGQEIMNKPIILPK